MDEADSAVAVADAVSKAVGITFRGKTDEQRVKAASRYLKAAVKVLDEKGDLIVDISQDYWRRKMALISLGDEAPHAAYVPMLKAIVASKHERRAVRYFALTAISKTPHDTVVEDLIVYLDDHELSMRAWEQLRKLTRSGILFRNEGEYGDTIPISATPPTAGRRLVSCLIRHASSSSTWHAGRPPTRRT